MQLPCFQSFPSSKFILLWMFFICWNPRPLFPFLISSSNLSLVLLSCLSFPLITSISLSQSPTPRCAFCPEPSFILCTNSCICPSHLPKSVSYSKAYSELWNSAPSVQAKCWHNGSPYPPDPNFCSDIFIFHLKFRIIFLMALTLLCISKQTLSVWRLTPPT